MFKTERVGCYLNTFSGYGDDNDSKELKLVFHVLPITSELAQEISPLLADRLFRDIDGEWQPAKEITKASFSSVEVPMQNITFHSLPELALPGYDAVLVPNCEISNLRAARGDAPGFRLEFDVVVPMDGITMRLVEQYYKSICFLTMEQVQREIQYSGGAVVVDSSLQEAADAGSETPAPKRGRKKKAVATEELDAAAVTVN